MQSAQSVAIPTPFGPVGGLLLMPEGAKMGLVFGHGAGTDITHITLERICQALFAVGIASLRYRFRFREFGGPPDKPAKGAPVTQSAVAYAQATYPAITWLAGGHSFGARMTAHALRDGLIEVPGAVFCSFPLHQAGKPNRDRDEVLLPLRQPLLFLSGDKDTMASLPLLSAVVAEIGPNATLVTLAGADHGYRIAKKIQPDPEAVFKEMAQTIADWAMKL